MKMLIMRRGKKRRTEKNYYKIAKKEANYSKRVC